MYDIKDHGHKHDIENTPRFENVVVDIRHSFLGLDPDQVVCFRESHRNFYIFTLILMTCILGLIAYGFVVKNTLSQSLQKKNKEIQTQKDLIEISNRNLISSLNYARRVQQAFLPTQNIMNQLFKESFVVNLPRDIVSGDFFWAGNFEGKTLLCLGDCTGHGVPGALLTMNGFNLLNALAAKFIDQPELLMMEMHKQLIANLDSGGEEVSDGMDLALLVFDSHHSKVQFVSAHHSVFIYANEEILELKGERRGLGPAYRNLMQEFQVQTLSLHPGSRIFAFSDGITDQFGGDETKKYSKKRLKEKLLEVQSLSISEQQEFWKKEVISWRGSNPQTDDIIFVGIQV